MNNRYPRGNVLTERTKIELSTPVGEMLYGLNGYNLVNALNRVNNRGHKPKQLNIKPALTALPTYMRSNGQYYLIYKS